MNQFCLFPNFDLLYRHYISAVVVLTYHWWKPPAIFLFILIKLSNTISFFTFDFKKNSLSIESYSIGRKTFIFPSVLCHYITNDKTMALQWYGIWKH